MKIKVCAAAGCAERCDANDGRVKFCSPACRKRTQQKKYRDKKKLTKQMQRWENRPIIDTAYAARGTTYEVLRDLDLLDKINRNLLTQEDAARMIGVDQASISRALAQYHKKLVESDAKRNFILPDVPELNLDNLDRLCDHFERFRVQMFQQPNGDPYLFPEHQRRWLRAILNAMCTGGKLLILSPPRHGKTELLSHLNVWMITCINRNVRVLQIGGNQDIAENSTGLVRDQLEDNELLYEQWCGDEGGFKPGRGKGSWTNGKFTIGNRTVPGIKSPTMVAIGRGGKILSRDADVIIVDDIEDDESTLSEYSREKMRNWWGTTVMSRKEEHTAMIVIGSRQHPDDLYSHLLVDPAWETIVETAHDDALCTVEPSTDQRTIWTDEDTYDQHDHACVLWPEIRSFRYLAGQKNSPLIAPFFAMVYLNEPTNDELVVFGKDMLDACLDRTRSNASIPEHYEDGGSMPVRLIAGLDPSGTGYQAAFLWAVDLSTGRRYAVDFDNRLGGGIKRAREIVQDWYETYGVTWWVIETNLYKGGINEDEMLRKYTQAKGIVLEGHETYGNKWDKQLGVSSLANWMSAPYQDPNEEKNVGRMISIPWGDAQTQGKWHEYRKQCLSFTKTNARGNRHSVSDVLMASWFPERTIRRWTIEWQAHNDPSPQPDFYPFVPAADLWS